MKTRNSVSLFLLFFLLIALFLRPASSISVKAQAGSAQDLISEVNSYRQANGLAAYQIDGGLMELAQSHSDYQATIQTCTHNRADGGGPASYGISAENIACGSGLSVSGAIYYQWADDLHASTLLGPETGMVGAGVAFDGNTVYYTLAVKRLSGDFNYRPPENVSQLQATDTGATAVDPILPVQTTTPNENGAITHVVKYGENLIDIATAYGLTLNDLYALNRSLSPTNPVYYEGQVLIIRAAFTETPYVTITYTPHPPTNTPRPTRTPRPTYTATPVRSPIPTRTFTPTPAYQIPTLDDLGSSRPIIAYALIIISSIGLVILVVTSFLPGRRGN